MKSGFVSIVGRPNVGKSTLLNSIINKKIAITSNTAQTTRNIIQGIYNDDNSQIVFVDTPGIHKPHNKLGKILNEQAYYSMDGVDLVLFLIDVTQEFGKGDEFVLNKLKESNIPVLLVINKIEDIEKDKLDQIKEKYTKAIFVSTYTKEGIDKLKNELISKLQNSENEIPIIGNLVPYGGKVILVVPIDSEAPKGRIILPQVQCIRDCLDNGIKIYIVRDTELTSALQDIKDVDLVVTDSQAFKKVSKIVPENIKLTGFSILFANHKGDLKAFVDGARKIDSLNKNSKILISESCTHNVSHEDIGRVKIPKLLNKYVGAELNYDFIVGHDFPENIKDYDLIIHCGGCMINRKTILNRINFCRKEEIPITNYGIVLAFLTGILDRSLEIFKTKNLI